MTNESTGNIDALQPLVQLKDHNIALLFCNYLLSLGIQAQLKNSPEGGYMIFCSDDKLSQAKIEFETFIAQPYAEKYQQAAWDRSETVTVNAGDLGLFDNFKDSFLAHAGIVTLLVFTACWLAFLGS